MYQEGMSIKLFVKIVSSDLTSVRQKLCEDLCTRLSQHPSLTVHASLIKSYEPKDIPREKMQSIVNFTKTNVLKYDDHLKNIHIRQLSNALKHASALTALLQDAKQNPEDESKHVFLVLEDDVLFRPHVADEIIKVTQDFPKDADMVVLGGRKKSADGTFMKLDFSNEPLETCESIMYTRNALEILVAKYIPIRFINNIHLSFLSLINNLTVYICPQPLFVDGSKYGIYVSVVSPENQLLLNKPYMDAYELITGDEGQYVGDQRAKVETLLSEIKYNEHPDVVYLKALHEMKCDSVEKARELFEKAYKLYQQSDTLLNAESKFLSAYIRLHAKLQ
jgi:GR25 family glycosyltransferase involved in LPS biosynthesis